MCEYLEEAYGDALYIAYTRPQLIRRELQNAKFEGPYAVLWRKLQLDRLPASFERWPRGGVDRCPRIVWLASPSVFLMSAERMYQYVVRSTTLVRLMRERGIRLWEYDQKKRKIIRLVKKPWELMRALVAGFLSAEVLGACGYYAAASMKYWAETGRIRSLENLEK